MIKKKEQAAISLTMLNELTIFCYWYYSAHSLTANAGKHLRNPADSLS